MRHITLGDGTVVDLKVARKDDYDYGRYESLYAWLCKVDQYLAKQYKLGDLIDNKAKWLHNLDENKITLLSLHKDCLLYTSDAADDLLCVDLGGRRIIKKKKK